MTALLLAGCASTDPWAGSPEPPAGVAPETWTIELHGQPLGLETRWSTPEVVVRRRELHVLADDEPHVLRSSTRLALAPDGAAVRWSTWEPGRAREGAGRAWVPDVVPPPASGAVDVLDHLDVVSVELERGPDLVTWTGPAGPARVALVAGRPVRAEVAGIALARADGPVEPPPPLDVARALSIPSPRFPDARGALVGVWQVGDREVRVDAPTWGELPAEREVVRALVREVAQRIDAAAVPGSTTGAEALAAGRGDCTEHALALVELARARGLTARTAAGRLYVEDDEGAWLVPHAWAEIELGGRWIGADPALGQFPADASHLRLGDWITELAATDGDEIRILALK